MSEEFRVRLQEELTQREAVERQLVKQVIRNLNKQLQLNILNIEQCEKSNGIEHTKLGGGCS